MNDTTTGYHPLCKHKLLCTIYTADFTDHLQLLDKQTFPQPDNIYKF